MAPATPYAPPTSQPTTLTVSGGRKLTLGRPIGRGASATVYRAILESENAIRRAVAVKIFDPVSAEEPDGAVAAIARAAARAASIRHPNVALMYELVVLESKQIVLVTELVDGLSLTTLIDRYVQCGRRMPLDLSLFIATEIAEGLHGARTARTPEGAMLNAVHLDLSANEVLLSWNGEVKLVDFGIGIATRWGSSVRCVRPIAERASSMAPEVVRGRTGDARSDVFSLGIILREMLVGPRFARSTSETEALACARDGVVPPTFTELQLPSDVRSILARALEPDPGRRYAHGTALAYDLRRVALSMGVGDGRMFLRSALMSEHEETDECAAPPDDEPTEEIAAVSLDVGRDRASGMMLKGLHELDAPDLTGDDDDL